MSMENQFLIDDVMDTDDLGLIDGSYPFIANMSNMSLLQHSQQIHSNPSLPPMHRKPMGMVSNQFIHNQLRNGQISPNGMDVDMMNQNNPAQGNHQSALFQAYASQFGLKQNTPQMPHENQHGDTSVEAYAALMGVKLESPRSMQKQQSNQFHQNDISRAQMNAQYFESLIQQTPMSNNNSSHNMSMTLPAGIGGGFQGNGRPIPMDPIACAPPRVDTTSFKPNHTTADALIDGVRIKSEKSIHFGSGPVGSQTLSPEMLSTMIQNNRQNSADASGHAFGSGTWNGSDFDYEKDQLISKADKSRERNRDHSRKSRLRKKAFVECLKTEVKQLQLFKDLCDQNADLIAMVSLDQDRKIHYLTASYNRILGFHEKKLVQEDISFFDLVHPDDVAKVRSELNRIAKYQDVTGVNYNVKHSKGNYWKGDMSARMCDQGIVITTRVQRQQDKMMKQ